MRLLRRRQFTLVHCMNNQLWSGDQLAVIATSVCNDIACVAAARRAILGQFTPRIFVVILAREMLSQFVPDFLQDAGFLSSLFDLGSGGSGVRWARRSKEKEVGKVAVRRIPEPCAGTPREARVVVVVCWGGMGSVLAIAVKWALL